MSIVVLCEYYVETDMLLTGLASHMNDGSNDGFFLGTDFTNGVKIVLKITICMLQKKKRGPFRRTIARSAIT